MMTAIEFVRRTLPRPVRAALSPLKHPGLLLGRQFVRIRSRGTVLGGPFQGTYFGWGSYHDAPCLLGTHESELYSALETLISLAPDLVVNLGAASGIYVVGMAARLPGVRLVAFEANPGTQKTLIRNVNQNGLAHLVAIRGLCTSRELAESLTGSTRPLVISDVEGAEKEILDPQLVPALKEAAMLVETHDPLLPGCRDTVIGRFAETHDISIIGSRARRLEEMPSAVLRYLAPRVSLRLMDELRAGPQEWLLMIPRSGYRQ